MSVSAQKPSPSTCGVFICAQKLPPLQASRPVSGPTRAPHKPNTVQRCQDMLTICLKWVWSLRIGPYASQIFSPLENFWLAVHRTAQKQSPLGKISHISTGCLHKNSHPNVRICTYPQALCTKTVTLLHKNSHPNHRRTNAGKGLRSVNVFKGLLKVYLNKVVNSEKSYIRRKTPPAV